MDTMNANATGDTPPDHTRVENFAAEVTNAVYPVVLRQGLTESWLQLELSVWRALVETLRNWTRERLPAVSSDDARIRQAEFLIELARSVSYTALKNGIKGPLPDWELALYRAVGLSIGRLNYVG